MVPIFLQTAGASYTSRLQALRGLSSCLLSAYPGFPDFPPAPGGGESDCSLPPWTLELSPGLRGGNPKRALRQDTIVPPQLIQRAFTPAQVPPVAGVLYLCASDHSLPGRETAYLFCETRTSACRTDWRQTETPSTGPTTKFPSWMTGSRKKPAFCARPGSIFFSRLIAGKQRESHRKMSCISRLCAVEWDTGKGPGIQAPARGLPVSFPAGIFPDRSRL